jgi:hypothetical protein
MDRQLPRLPTPIEVLRQALTPYHSSMSTKRCRANAQSDRIDRGELCRRTVTRGNEIVIFLYTIFSNNYTGGGTILAQY